MPISFLHLLINDIYVLVHYFLGLWKANCNFIFDR